MAYTVAYTVHSGIAYVHVKTPRASDREGREDEGRSTAHSDMIDLTSLGDLTRSLLGKWAPSGEYAHYNTK